jgi:hypothetical protein
LYLLSSGWLVTRPRKKAPKLKPPQPANVAAASTTAEQKHQRRWSDGCIDQYSLTLAERDDVVARVDALAADNTRQYMAMQRACTDLRTLAAVVDATPADELRLMLLSIATELKAGCMQVQIQHDIDTNTGIMRTDDDVRNASVLQGI